MVAFEDLCIPASAISRTHQGLMSQVTFPELSFTSVSAVIKGPTCGLKNKRAHIWEDGIKAGGKVAHFLLFSNRTTRLNSRRARGALITEWVSGRQGREGFWCKWHQHP